MNSWTPYLTILFPEWPRCLLCPSWSSSLCQDLTIQQFADSKASLFLSPLAALTPVTYTATLCLPFNKVVCEANRPNSEKHILTQPPLSPINVAGTTEKTTRSSQMRLMLPQIVHIFWPHTWNIQLLSSKMWTILRKLLTAIASKIWNKNSKVSKVLPVLKHICFTAVISRPQSKLLSSSSCGGHFCPLTKYQGKWSKTLLHISFDVQSLSRIGLLNIYGKMSAS